MNPIPNHCIECDKPTVNILCNKCMMIKDKLIAKKKEKKMKISNCCGVLPLTETYDDLGMCSECKEHAVFEEEEDEE